MVDVGPLSPDDVVRVARDGARVTIGSEAREAIVRARKHVDDLAASDTPVYGVSTGFGALANRHIAPEQRTRLQKSLIRSHAAGTGPRVEDEVVRALMLLRLSTMCTGHTGVRLTIAEAYADMLNAGLSPVVLEHGSLGCSGDLAPLAHCALAVTGEGEVVDGGALRPAAEALADHGLAPVELAEKEGLALINGTDGMLGMLVLALADLRRLLDTADLSAALSIEGLMGTDRVLAPDLQALRPHPGQATSAAHMAALLDGSPIVASHRYGDDRVQDAYSLRCAPQVNGAARDTVDHAATVAGRELAAAIDNPSVLDDGRLESHGNFHGAPLAYVLDFLAIVVADVASMSERRTDRFLDAARNHGLPPFLADDPGVDSGLMIAQYTQAAIVSELKRLAAPASVDSIPSSAMQEDHVSMGWSSARKLRRSVEGLAQVLAIEIMTAARGVELRAPLQPAAATGAAIKTLREKVDGPGSRPVPHARHRGGHRARPVGRSHRRNRRSRAHDGLRPRGGSDMTDIRAARGTTLTARSWQTEAPMRMLMNNLDPEVAEHPEQLIVYGGTGKAARDWPSYDAIIRTLTDLRDDETLLVQSGRPVGVMRTHEWAPRVLIANSNLVGDWATWPEFRRLEAAGLTMYGQMTAGSWIYIGTQGILQGTYETFGAVAAKSFNGTLAGTITLTAGLGGMGGAQPLAVTMNDGVCVCIEVDQSRITRRIEHRYLDVQADDLDARDAAGRGRQGPAQAVVDRGARQRRGHRARAARGRGADRRRHRPDQRARPAVLPAPRRRVRGLGGGAGEGPRRLHRARPRIHGPPLRGHGRLRRCRRRGVRLRQLAAGRGA